MQLRLAGRPHLPILLEALRVDKRLLEILCCPVTRAPLRLLAKRELEAVNAAANAGTLRSADGSAWTDPVTAALITVDGSRIYRIEDDIPVMLADQAFETSAIDEFPATPR